ncbi:EAL domain-containing protein [Thalassotalea sp. LPB0316]|uniref:putative bifunctional diguanylate cyclase/phosphodiesterase n=1 Tax=Thalassotalea sp. LPB0316 TaxID=2769490 RepID=UPI0018685273|nr:GGDEF domain-containing protein [Thalassotalea sp. LPB0316]QOL24661.1 EAL domain-containing protein [Thalassotalea sp. LPB0316]
MLLTSDDIESAIYFSKLHLASIIFGYPVFVLIFGYWTRFKHTKLVFALFTLLSVPLLFINFLSETSLRYGQQVELVSYITIFGDQAYLLTGETYVYFPIMHFIYGAMSLFLAYCALRFYRRKQNELSAILVFTVFLQFITSYIGYQIDQLNSNWVYVGGVPMTLLSFIALTIISRGYKEKSIALSSEVKQKESLHLVFSRLAKISNEENDASFYQQAIELLCQYSKADYVIYGLVDDQDRSKIRTNLVYKDGNQVDNFLYERAGTPCENVLTIDACVHRSGVALDYPKDLMLMQEGIEAYVGYPIVGANKCTIGVLVLLFKAPLNDEQILRTVTDVFATRISAELRREALQNELKATAYVDYLTRLPNRTKLLTYINRINTEFAGRDEQALLMLFDLDYFGDINRKYGYDIGDQVIKVIGERLNNYSAEGLFFARSGGDEFALVINKVKTDINALINVHWTAIKAIVNQTCFVGNRKINISCTMGAVLFPSQQQDNFDVISASEQALIRAKEQGRGKYTFFDPTFLSNKEYIRALEADLLEALKVEDGLSVYYQPKVNKAAELFGAEALLRWNSDKRGFVSPAEFIPVAEETGAIHALGRWVVEQVIADFCQWREQGLPLVPISINVTASQFEDPEFIAFLISIVKRLDLPYHLVELELTESGLLTDKDNAIITLSKLRKHGFTIALDDFGTGYSSLSYLNELPLDVLKVDKSFVDGLYDERNRELVKSILAIGQAMELINIAEGTESLEQVELLSSMGCQYFQGYYYSKPLPKIEFEAWLKKPLANGHKI